jgi:hypothetical protein
MLWDIAQTVILLWIAGVTGATAVEFAKFKRHVLMVLSDRERAKIEVEVGALIRERERLPHGSRAHAQICKQLDRAGYGDRHGF